MAQVREGGKCAGDVDSSSCGNKSLLGAANKRLRNSNSHVPPGFRFHPTDDELIHFYLRRKVFNLDVEQLDVIPEIDLNKLEPWDLRDKCKMDSSHVQTEWYFFSHKDKKYPTGSRTNRATAAGFWKATGRDKAVHSSITTNHHQQRQLQRIGMRKTLVFYRGRAPHGKKTDWIMHEYRLEDTNCTIQLDHSQSCTSTTTNNNNNNEDGWVVCRVFKKRNMQDKVKNEHSSSKNPNLSDEESRSPADYDTSDIILNEAHPVEYYHRPDYPIPSPAAHHAASTVVCKQEKMEDDSSLIPQYTIQAEPTYLQLPGLESSDQISLNNISQCVCTEDFTTSSMNACSEDCQTATHIQDCDSKPLFLMTSELDDNVVADLVHNNNQFTETWNLYESIARYHPDLCNFHSSLSQSLHLGRVPQPVEYTNSCEVLDLWNFTT